MLHLRFSTLVIITQRMSARKLTKHAKLYASSVPSVPFEATEEPPKLKAPATEAKDWFEDNLSSQLFASATRDGDVVGENRENRDRLPGLQVAQVTAPLPVNFLIIISPNLFPGLIPPSNPIVTPINSVLTPELIFAPNNTPAVPSNAPVAPKPESTRDPRFIIAPQVLDPRVVDPFSTQFVLNGNKVSHFTTGASQ